MKNKNFDNLKRIFILGLPLFIYMVIYLLWWSNLEKNSLETYSLIHSYVDNKIPFCEYFVIPYIFWFAYMVIIIIYQLIEDDRDGYYRFIFFLSSGMTLFLIISTLFPNTLHIRPAYFPRDNFFTALVRMIYKKDTATNVFPSIHVYNSIGCYHAVKNSEKFSKSIKTASFVMSTLIVLSTVFIKQHSVFDVICAVSLGCIAEYISYRTKTVNKMVSAISGKFN